jgi:membrane protein YqaA with SNARE-associated domain
MTLERLAPTLGLYVATYVVCLVSAVVPVVNAEAYLLGVGALASREALVPLVLLSALGQMSGKACLYLSGRGVLRLPLARRRARLQELHARLTQHPRSTGAVLFASALVGLPPFYATSIVAGMLRARPAAFLVLGFVGRALRFAGFLALPDLVRSLRS